MKNRKDIRLMGLGFGLALVVTSPISMGAMPASEFACQVVVDGGKVGLVLVQADTSALAEKAALGAEAFTIDNMRGLSTSVVRCIRRGEESFPDYQFQQFYESVPL